MSLRVEGVPAADQLVVEFRGAVNAGPRETEVARHALPVSLAAVLPEPGMSGMETAHVVAMLEGAAVGEGESSFSLTPGARLAVTVRLSAPQIDLLAAGDLAAPDLDVRPADLSTLSDLSALPDLFVKKPQGSLCDQSAECDTAGGCVDGRCCDTACNGVCAACNLSGREGTCSPVAAGSLSPAGHPGCTSEAASTCGLDGTCDGSGACRRWPLNTPCASAHCDSGTNQLTPAGSCDGLGACVTPPAITCAPFVCENATRCWGSCTGSGQCSSGNVCNNSSCGLKVKGASCSNSNECQSGFCVDTVCCDSACTQTCKACNLATAPGTCTLVPVNQDPRGVCPTGSGANATCAPGGCDGTTTKCKLAGTGTQCRAATCDAVNNQQVLAANCDGLGACPSVATQTCAPYLCGATACKAAPCSSSGDCSAGNYCDSTQHCVPFKALGIGCGADGECGSGHCAPEGICCNTACAGQCEQCSAAGTCGFAGGTPAAPRAACNGQNTSPCGGSCSGSSPDCFYPTVSCGTASCNIAGHLTLGHPDEAYAQGAGTCMSGSCVLPPIAWCGSYQCQLISFGGGPPAASCYSSCTTSNYSTHCNDKRSTCCSANMCGYC